MVSWDDLGPPQLEVVARGRVSITSGGTTLVEDVADEGDQILVFFGHTDTSADGSDVTYTIDDDATSGTQDILFDEAAAGGDSVIDYTVVRIIP